MQLFIGKLLKRLNEEFPKYITVDELRKSISNDIDFTIHEAKKRDLIVYPKYKSDKSPLNVQDKITISIEGYKLLNQLLIKKTLEDLNKAINNFENSSNASSQKIENGIDNLNKSIKEFNESSDRYSKLIIFLTAVLIAFTILLVFFTPTSNTILEKTVIMVLVVVITFFGIWILFKKRTFLRSNKTNEDVRLWLFASIDFPLYLALSVFLFDELFGFVKYYEEESLGKFWTYVIISSFIFVIWIIFTIHISKKYK